MTDTRKRLTNTVWQFKGYKSISTLYNLVPGREYRVNRVLLPSRPGDNVKVVIQLDTSERSQCISVSALYENFTEVPPPLPRLIGTKWIFTMPSRTPVGRRGFSTGVEYKVVNIYKDQDHPNYIPVILEDPIAYRE